MLTRERILWSDSVGRGVHIVSSRGCRKDERRPWHPLYFSIFIRNQCFGMQSIISINNKLGLGVSACSAIKRRGSAWVTVLATGTLSLLYCCTVVYTLGESDTAAFVSWIDSFSPVCERG